MQSLIDDQALRERLAAAALAECLAIYGWDIVGGLIADVYRAVATGGAPSPFEETLPIDPACRFRAEPHLL